MVPVALLEASGALEPNGNRPVLAADVCASPGSKTSQLLEALARRTANDRHGFESQPLRARPRAPPSSRGRAAHPTSCAMLVR